MPSTYTLNNGIELIATGEQSGTWGDTTNTNLELLDTALDGQVTFTLTTAGSSSSPTALPIADGVSANSEGRNRLVIVNDGGDLGATAYVQLTPNDAEKIIYIRNDLSGSRSLILFQGTYSASRDYEVPAGTTAVVYFTGGGSGAAVAANVFNNAYFDSLRLGDVSVTAIIDDDTMATATATNIATSESIKAYVDAQVEANNELSEVLANGNTTGGTNILITSGDSIAAPDASGTDQAGTDVIVSGGAGTGTGAGGEVLFKVAPAGSTGSSVNALATGMKLDSTKALYVDTINELTSAAGVTIDSVLLKDDVVNASDVETSKISANDGTTAINIADSTGAVDIDTSLNVDGTIEGDGLSIVEPTTNLSVLFGTTANSTTSEIKQSSRSSNGAQAQTSMKVTGSGGEAISAWEFKADTASGALTKVMDIDGNGDFTIYEADGTTASFFYDADTGLTVNEGQNARDFTVKSDNNAAMLYVDGTNDYVAVGSTSITPPSDYHFFSYGATSGARSAFVHGAGDGGIVISGSAGGSNASLILGNNWGTNGSTFSEEWRMVMEGAYDDLTFKYGGSTTAFTMSAAGAAKFYEGLVVNNNNSTGSDFQVKSQNQDYMLFVDAGEDRVGVNTSSPTSTFSVGSTTSSSGDIAQRTTKTAVTLTPSNTDAGGFDIDVGWVSGGQGPFTFSINGTEAMRITSSRELQLDSDSAFKTDSTDTTSTTETTVYSFNKNDYTGAKLLVCVDDTTDTERYITEILITHDDTTAVSTEYGQVATDTALATFDVDISGGSVRLLATPASSNSMTFKVMSTQLLA